MGRAVTRTPAEGDGQCSQVISKGAPAPTLRRGYLGQAVLSEQLKDEVARAASRRCSGFQRGVHNRSDVKTLVAEVANHLDEVFGDDADFAVLGESLTYLGLRIDHDSRQVPPSPP